MKSRRSFEPAENADIAGILRNEIAARGAIPFHDFMAAALYHPERGYYRSGRAAIGRRGDFFTNVSVGALFGELLANQFAEIWRRLDCPAEFAIVEQGSHRGDFARDVLAWLHLHSPDLHARTRYVMVEPSSRGREAQRETLGVFAEDTTWVASLSELEPFTGVHFSNELIDSFPVHLVSWTGEKWIERYVTLEANRFAFTGGYLSDERLRERLEQVPAVPPGYTTEVNLAALDWTAELATKLDRGYVLAIDYGFPRAEYYRADRTSGTLAGYAQHHRENDLLNLPGAIDLTAHVEFTSVVEAAEGAGLCLEGFCDQHHFMVGLGKRHFADAVAPVNLRAFKTLMHPGLLGLSFKALCLSKGVASPAPLAGFAFARDSRALLGLE